MLFPILFSIHCFSALIAALPSQSENGTSQPHGCREVSIPITVEVPRFLISTEIRDDWDVAALVFNLTRRDSGQGFPLPITGNTAAPVKSTYDMGATFCGNGSTTLILTHGILESKRYWQPDFPDSDQYNFIEAAVAAGYSVLSYDRIGVGSSSRVNSITDAQFQVQVAVLNSLVDHVRDASTARKVALVGHSYGAYISIAAAAAASNPSRNVSMGGVDAVILTGFAGGFSNFGPFLAGAGLRVARDRQPERWGALDPGYLTAVDAYADAYIYYHAGNFERRVAEWTHARGSEPFAVGELPSLLATNITYDTVTAPVQIVQGKYDVSACGGNCEGQLTKIRANLSGASVVETVEDLPAGHNLNLHLVAPRAFELMFGFLKRQGL
ncbi:alpha/beta-hydrolase [Apiospora kogelbergensis]|uniref:alpha/beta-hydrolase n=1 Tax=Apiospora kogelbergensis TaxID=1337665 RepID=UPI00313016AD